MITRPVAHHHGRRVVRAAEANRVHVLECLGALLGPGARGGACDDVAAPALDAGLARVIGVTHFRDPAAEILAFLLGEDAVGVVGGLGVGGAGGLVGGVRVGG